MIITIINYLDRGTLNYMWVANIEYKLVGKCDNARTENQAEFLQQENVYKLVSKKGDVITQKAEYVSFKNDGKIVINR
jgi:ACS family hexuronate transporter-like MFS transporter